MLSEVEKRRLRACAKHDQQWASCIEMLPEFERVAIHGIRPKSKIDLTIARKACCLVAGRMRLDALDTVNGAIAEAQADGEIASQSEDTE